MSMTITDQELKRAGTRNILMFLFDVLTIEQLDNSLA